MKRLLTLLTCLGLGAPATAQPMDRKTEDFIASNLIAIFYHELGHAFIDILKLPIYGQEEDAADVLSALLVHETFDEETAVHVVSATAHGFLREHETLAASGDEVAYWDVHGPDLQRYFTFVCLFYGADPDARGDIAAELNLPEGRQDTCEEEFDLAAKSWGPVMEELEEKGGGRSIRFLADYRTDVFGKLTADVISDQVDAMNEEMSLPKPLLVRVEPCGSANAFYDPKLREITMCTEYARDLAELAPK